MVTEIINENFATKGYSKIYLAKSIVIHFKMVITFRWYYHKNDLPNNKKIHNYKSKNKTFYPVTKW